MELALWQQQWKLKIESATQMPSAIEILNIPTIFYTLFRTLCTLRATNPNAERSKQNLAQNNNAPGKIKRFGSQYKLRH